MTEFTLPPTATRLQRARAQRLQDEIDALFLGPRPTIEDLRRLNAILDELTEVRAKYITPVMLARGFFR